MKKERFLHLKIGTDYKIKIPKTPQYLNNTVVYVYKYNMALKAKDNMAKSQLYRRKPQYIGDVK